MLIGICGAICSGKTTTASFLVHEYGFRRLRLVPEQNSPKDETSSDLACVIRSQVPDEEDALTFTNAEELLAFVTRHWRELWVTTDICDEDVLEMLLRRPFFLLIGIESPLGFCWQRYSERCTSAGAPVPSLNKFVAWSDWHNYLQPKRMAPVLHRAHVHLLNNRDGLENLRISLRSLNLTDESRLRPSWDQYFMELADLAAQRSNCMKRRVGCVLVREKRVVSTGYNGTPRGMANCNEGGCPRCNAATIAGVALDTCLCLHAEENALLEAGRERISGHAVLYCNTCPCLTCSVKIVQVGISEVVYGSGYSLDSKTQEVFNEAGVQLRQFSPPPGGLVDLDVRLESMVEDLDVQDDDEAEAGAHGYPSSGGVLLHPKED